MIVKVISFVQHFYCFGAMLFIVNLLYIKMDSTVIWYLNLATCSGVEKPTKYTLFWNQEIMENYCIVLYCIVLYSILFYCIALYCIVLYCIVLYCIVLYCIVLYCIVLYCIVLETRTIFMLYLFCQMILPTHFSSTMIV